VFQVFFGFLHVAFDLGKLLQGAVSEHTKDFDSPGGPIITSLALAGAGRDVLRARLEPA
jgi:hypothetical protein